jgi:hypothetical protein
VVKASITGDLPWTFTSQRGLASRPDDDSFYIAGWNSGVIFHIKGLSAPDRGALLDVCFPADTNISGLAWNPGSRTLWAATNSPTDTIYQLNPETCDVLSTLAHPRPGFNGQGLELDEDGNLWMVSVVPPTVYLVESGVPAFVDVPWLSASATSGTLAPGQSQAVTITVNATGLSVGTYNAQLFVQSNSGRRPSLRVPISLLVSRYRQGVNSGGQAYTDRTGDPWAKDQKYATGRWGYLFNSKAVNTGSAIVGTLDDPLYQTARVGGDEYRFDGLPEGVYQVELRFAEIQGKRPFQRLYDVIVEGGLVLPAHDIAAEVGRLTADEHTFFVSIADGQISIRFIPRSGFGQPIINAIRLTHRPDR